MGGAVLGGGAELISGSLVKDVTFMLVCDIQVKEKAAKGVIVRKDTQVDTKVSDTGTSRQTTSEVGIRKEYRTRIVTTANKANLTQQSPIKTTHSKLRRSMMETAVCRTSYRLLSKLEEAQELMFKKTAFSMSGFFRAYPVVTPAHQI